MKEEKEPADHPAIGNREEKRREKREESREDKPYLLSLILPAHSEKQREGRERERLTRNRRKKKAPFVLLSVFCCSLGVSQRVLMNFTNEE